MIRPLYSADLDQYLALRKEALQNFPLSFGADPNAPTDTSQVKNTLSRYNPENFIHGYYSNEALVGMAGFVRQQNIKRKHHGHIWGMYVKPEYQGKGIGEQLLRSLMEPIRELPGLEKVKLSVTDQSPAAHALYLRLGFQEYGREENAMQWEGQKLTEIFMEQYL